MLKKVIKFSSVTILALAISVSASLSVFAAEKIVTTTEGGSVTISDVTKEIKIVDEGSGAGDTIYVTSAPVKLTINGASAHPKLSFRSQAKLSGDSFDIGEKFEKIDVIDNAVELTKPGYYVMGVMFGSDYTSANVAQLAIQVIGESSDPSAEPEAKPETMPVSNKGNATPTASRVSVNSKAVSFQAYNIDGNNYFKLRDLAKAVTGSNKQFEVGFDQAKNAISLSSNKTYTSVGDELQVSKAPESKNAVPTTSKVYLDGKEVQLTAYNIDGNNYFKLRDVAKSFNIGVTFDAKTNQIGIDTSISYKEE